MGDAVSASRWDAPGQTPKRSYATTFNSASSAMPGAAAASRVSAIWIQRFDEAGQMDKTRTRPLSRVAGTLTARRATNHRESR